MQWKLQIVTLNNLIILREMLYCAFMCGISFIWDKKNKLDEGPIERMNKSLNHRGPDAQRIIKNAFNGGTVWMGHTRLKIIDPSDDANQPFRDSTSFLAYNGEIYNYKELKNKLDDQEITFHTKSDTEVLFQFLKKNNDLSELNGMYTFVYIDILLKKIQIGRDPFGIKPLYIFEDDNYLILSSEIKAIFKSGLVQKKIDQNQVNQFFIYKHVESPFTIFENIRQFPSNQSLTIKPTERITKGIQNFNREKNHEVDDNFTLKKTKDLLLRSLENHIQADVPVGLFLSGGVDSTLLLALHQELGYEPLQSFSIGFSQNNSFGTNDDKFATVAAKKFGSVHQSVQIDASVLNQLDDLIDPNENPIADSATLLTSILSKKACEFVSVVLTGAGADELFAGYNRIKAFQFYLNHPRFPYKIGKILPTGFDHPLRKRFQLLKKMGNKIGENNYDTFIRFTSLELVNYKSTNNSHFDINNALRHDINHFLKDDVLALTDQYTMKHSLEARVPYLDLPLANHSFSYGGDYLLKNGKKWILKKILNQYGDHQFSNRKKEGFGIPLGKWIHDDSKILNFLQQKNNPLFNYISREVAQKKADLHLRKRADFSQELWSLITLNKWLEKQA